MDLNVIIGQSLAPIITIALTAIAGLLGKLIVNLIKKSKSETDDRLAAIAVAWAEDALGTGEKLNGAAKKLSELTKGRIKEEDAKVLVAATYQKLMGELSVLKK